MKKTEDNGKNMGEKLADICAYTLYRGVKAGQCLNRSIRNRVDQISDAVNAHTKTEDTEYVECDCGCGRMVPKESLEENNLFDNIFDGASALEENGPFSGVGPFGGMHKWHTGMPGCAGCAGIRPGGNSIWEGFYGSKSEEANSESKGCKCDGSCDCEDPSSEILPDIAAEGLHDTLQDVVETVGDILVDMGQLEMLLKRVIDARGSLQENSPGGALTPESLADVSDSIEEMGEAYDELCVSLNDFFNKAAGAEARVRVFLDAHYSEELMRVLEEEED